MLKLRVINNGDHAGLIWFPSDLKPIADCRGFGIQRKLTRAGVAASQTWLHNSVGFEQGQAAPPAGSEWQWPIQRYLWWDYSVQPGDVVQYQVVPVIGPDYQHLALDAASATPWSAVETISGQDGPTFEAYFNRGIIASQWVARALNDEAAAQKAKGSPHALLLSAISDKTNDLRLKLGGLLLATLKRLLDAAVQDGKTTIYAALYELNDPDVLDALTALGSRCNLILGNGAFKPPANDENAAVRADLRKTPINLFDRLVSSGHFAHNKFIVFCDAKGAAQQVWTGSTNTTETGLCTQANNGLLIKDATVADSFLKEWQRLRAAGNGFPPSLAATNSVQTSFEVAAAGGATNRVTTWFAPTQHGQDMVDARSLINKAQDGILFLNFNPGVYEADPAQWTLLQTIVNRHTPGSNPDYKPDLYIRGVVNQEVAKLTSPDPAAPVHPVALYDGGTQQTQRMDADVLVPDFVRTQYKSWETELKGASSVMIHSKVVILDPFGDAPVVMTGSHNQGMKASRANDDNLVIIEGAAPLAQSYALNAIAIFQEYRWRHYISQHAADPAHAWGGLEDNDTWQDGHLTHDQAEIDFWLK